MSAPHDESSTLPAPRRGEVLAQLEPGEGVVGWFEPDLTTGLRYADGLVVLTDRRLLARAEAVASGDGNGDGQYWRSWPLADAAELRAREQSGLGLLDLVGPAGRLGHWRYTVARAPGAHRLASRFEAVRRDGRIEPEAAVDPNCPSCGEPLPSDQGSCPACAPPPVPSTRSALFRLFRFARPHLAMGALGFVLTLVATAVGLFPTYLTKPLTDRVIIPLFQASGPAQRAALFRLAGYYLGLLGGTALLSWLLSWARTYVLAWVSEVVAVDLRNRTYAHLQQLSLEFFGGKRTGDLMSRISTDTDRICNFLSINLLDFATDMLMLVGSVGFMVWMDPVLAAVSLMPLPLIYALVQHYRERLRRQFEAASRAWGHMTSVLADTIPGIRVVKAFAQERREVDRFARSNAHVLDINNRANATWSFFGPTVAMLTQAGLLVIWGFGAWRVADRRIEPGDLFAFQLFMGKFYVRLESMSRIVQAAQRAAAGAGRIFEILDRKPSVPDPVRPVHPDRIEGAIELRHVGFRYGNRRVLQDVSFAIRPGELIGLVGPSGAGKSTLVNLVCRFYDVTEGAILVDGIDIRRFPVSEYRRHIGIVLQEPFLFYGTIAENIAYARPEATREEIIAAARAARAHDFILRLPDGYDSLVGERGQSLSGGERQRISIARALLIDPRILILDEATSSVDTETEREIQEALDNLIQGRTTIAIAHRLSTLRKADRLVVLERGQIAEVGHHHDLLKAPGPYARLHHAQAELAKMDH